MKPIQRRIVYGLGFGFAAYLAGWVATLYALPPNLYGGDPEWWHVATWGYASAHFVAVTPPDALTTLPDGSVDVLVQHPDYRFLRIVPPVTLTVFGVLATLAVGDRGSVLKYLLNSGTVVLGYLPLAFLATAHAGSLTNARVVVSAGVILFFGLISGAALLKSTGTSIQLPLFSPGYLAFVAVLTVLGTVAVAQALWTVVAMAFLCAPLGGVLALFAERLPK
jgi:hypothetical protein